MSWKRVKLGKILKQYRIEHWVQNDTMYKQVSILNDGSVVLRGEKIGKDIGRKRQFIIDLDKYPHTLIFTRQLLLQGSIGMASGEVNKCIVTENMPMFSVKDIEPQFLFIFLKSELFKSQVRGLKTSGTAQKSLHERQFLELEIPLPSLSEQNQIIEAFREKQEKIEIVSNEIKQQQTCLQLLRQTILQEAVQGKLTKQDPIDEPATQLLKRTKTEKEKLIKAGKLKKEKELPPITEDEIPFELPEGWVWCRWRDLLAFEQYSMKRGPFGSSLRKDMFVDNGIRVFEQYNPINDDPYWVRYYVTEKKYEELKAFTTIAGDLLISCSGATLGRITELPDDVEFGIINQALLKLTLNKNVISNVYFKRIFRSSYLQDKILEEAGGSAIPNMVGVSTLKEILIPLPPLAEQQRIVAKVHQLQQQLSQLEVQVQQSRQYAQQLLQSVLKEAFEEKNNNKELSSHQQNSLPV